MSKLLEQGKQFTIKTLDRREHIGTVIHVKYANHMPVWVKLRLEGWGDEKQEIVIPWHVIVEIEDH